MLGEREGRCPDGGYCHGTTLQAGSLPCAPGACLRVQTSGPLSGVFPGDVWPAAQPVILTRREPPDMLRYLAGQLKAGTDPVIVAMTLELVADELHPPATEHPTNLAQGLWSARPDGADRLRYDPEKEVEMTSQPPAGCCGTMPDKTSPDKASNETSTRVPRTPAWQITT